MLDDYTVSYAQNREDIIINAFFPDIKKGFYVDVGANDPVDDSVTKIFYDKGWTGLNIEPSPRLFQKLVRARKRDVNIQVGVGVKEGKLKFRDYENHGLSTFSSEMQKQYEKQSNAKTASYTDYTVSVKPLSSVLQAAAVDHIHFLKVDVEGLEYEVLASNDWSKYRPELICVEANHIIKDWHPILTAADYKLVYADGLNEYFLASESIARNENFNYVESLVLTKPIINAGLAKRLILAEENEAHLKHYISEVSRFEHKNASLLAQLSALQGELNSAKSLRHLAVGLYTEVDNKILRSIDKHGYKRKVKKTGSQQVKTAKLQQTSKQELLVAAKIYDTQSYFQLHSPKSTMKIRYRIASKTYRITRDASKRVAKKSYHLLKAGKG